MTADASLLLEGADGTACPSIIRTLNRFGAQAVAFAYRFGTRVVPLRAHQQYDEASPALKRLGVDVDAWPAPPAGLFVVEERTVYLRSRSPMTVAHELCLLQCVNLKDSSAAISLLMQVDIVAHSTKNLKRISSMARTCPQLGLSAMRMPKEFQDPRYRRAHPISEVRPFPDP